MPDDPKQLVSATEQIKKFLAEFEKTQKSVVTDLAQSEKKLKEANELSNQFLSNCDGMIKALTESRVKFEHLLKSCDDVKKTYTANKDFDMIQRRFLEAEKTVQQVNDEWLEKIEAMHKNKGDKKAKADFELCDKALEKMIRSMGDLKDRSEAIIPAEMIKLARSCTSELPKDVDDYVAALKVLMKEIDPAKYRKLVERLNY